MGSRSPLAAAARMLEASRALPSSVRCWCGKAAMARSSTLLSMEMVSGSYAARLIVAAQTMAHSPPNAQPSSFSKCPGWSIYVRVVSFYSILITRRSMARATLVLGTAADPRSPHCGDAERAASYEKPRRSGALKSHMTNAAGPPLRLDNRNMSVQFHRYRKFPRDLTIHAWLVRQAYPLASLAQACSSADLASRRVP